jgi:hypothetical protein
MLLITCSEIGVKNRHQSAEQAPPCDAVHEWDLGLPLAKHEPEPTGYCCSTADHHAHQLSAQGAVMQTHNNNQIKTIKEEMQL